MANHNSNGHDFPPINCAAPVLGPGRPRRSALYAPRVQRAISVTDRENYILHRAAECYSEQKLRRIYRGEMMALLVRDLWPELYAGLSAEFDALEAGRAEPPSTDEQVAAAQAKQKEEADAYRRANGLPTADDMQKFKEFNDAPRSPG